MSDEKVKNVSPDNAPAKGSGEHKDERKAHRYRVNWHTDIVFADQSTHQGFVNDLSVQGTSLFLGESPTSEDATLHIHVPPLSLTSKPHIIAVYGKMVYAVFDSEKQQFRAAFVFIRFHQSSDQAYLEERLSRHQVEIHEPSHRNIVEL